MGGSGCEASEVQSAKAPLRNVLIWYPTENEIAPDVSHYRKRFRDDARSCWTTAARGKIWCPRLPSIAFSSFSASLHAPQPRFNARARRSSAVILPAAVFPPLLPPIFPSLAPCSLKKSRGSGVNFF